MINFFRGDNTNRGDSSYAHLDETTPEPVLEEKKQEPSGCYILVRPVVRPVTCFLAATPVPFMCFLAGISTRDLGELNSWNDLGDDCLAAPWSRWTLAVIACLCSYFALTSLYLDFWNKAEHQLVNFSSGFNHSKKDVVLLFLLFALSFLTSLIFGSLGGETMSFAGGLGYGFGFSANFIGFFATRFLSAVNYNFDYFSQEKIKYRQCLQIINCLKLRMNEFSDFETKEKIDDTRPINKNFELDAKRAWCFNEQAGVIKFVSLSLLLPSIYFGFLTSSIKGLNLVFGSSYGEHENYQDAGSFIWGSIISLLTMIFYSLSIMQLVDHATQFYFENRGQHEKIELAIWFIICSFASTGFYIGADTSRAEGNLDYLSEYKFAVPVLLCVTVALMLFSNRLQIINNRRDDYYRGGSHDVTPIFSALYSCLFQPEASVSSDEEKICSEGGMDNKNYHAVLRQSPSSVEFFLISASKAALSPESSVSLDQT